MSKKKKGALSREKIIKLSPEEIEKVSLLRNKITSEVCFVDKKPYSHTIISLCLRQIADIVDKEYANQLITDFKLDQLGWVKVSEK
jgi:hypothetical protein